MLSLELKELLIDPTAKIWTAIGESFCTIVDGTLEEILNGQEKYLDQITLYSKITLPSNEITEIYIEIPFQKSDEDFIKSFMEYKESFSIDEYAKDWKSKTKYDQSECEYIAECLKEKIDETYKILSLYPIGNTAK